jgi:hypothetical protein
METPKTHNIKNPWKLELAVKSYLEFMDNDDEYSEDRLENYKNEVFEKAMESFAGEDIWEWINNRRQ